MTLRSVICATLATLICHTGASARDPTSNQAKQAKAVYKQETAKLRRLYNEKLEEAAEQYGELITECRDRYIESLQKARKKALVDEDLDEAQRVLATIAALKGPADDSDTGRRFVGSLKSELLRAKAEIVRLKRSQCDSVFESPESAEIPKEASTFRNHSYLVFGTMPKRLGILACKNVGGNLINASRAAGDRKRSATQASLNATRLH